MPLRPAFLAYLAPLLLLGACDQTPPAGEGRPLPADPARALAQRVPVVDGHVDLPYRLMMGEVDVGVASDTGDFDLVRAQRGGLDAPFMSIYVAAGFQPQNLAGDWAPAKAEADRLIDLVEKVVADNPDQAAVAQSVADITRNHAAGLISLPMGMENGAPIGLDLANLAYFYRRGIRYITLTHGEPNQIADSSYSVKRPHDGLSDFGVEVVKEMNRLGIMVDISHVSDAAFWDVLEASRTPVIASHSSLRRFTPGWERNMADDMVKALGAQGGVIMINYGSAFLTQSANRWRPAMLGAWAAHAAANGLNAADEAARTLFAERYREEHPYPYASVADVADHIDAVVALAGIDHVGLGSDFDGVGDTLPEGLKDVADLPNLIAELMQRGYATDDIEKILSGNILRLWSTVEAYAARQVPG